MNEMKGYNFFVIVVVAVLPAFTTLAYSFVSMMDRRSWLVSSCLGQLLVPSSMLVPTPRKEADDESDDNNFLDSSSSSSLTWIRPLGQGSYKDVYLVQSSSDETISTTITSSSHQYYALAIERIRNEQMLQDELRAIQIVQQLGDDDDCFEKVIDWWFQQQHGPLEFSPGEKVIGLSKDRTQRRVPTSTNRAFKSLYLFALKPLYDIDLRSFIKQVPLLDETTKRTTAKGSSSKLLLAKLGIRNDETTAIRLVSDMLRIGRKLSEQTIVHRDIKPGNFMLWRKGKVVLIDFGFAAKPDDNMSANSYYCITKPIAKIKGDVGYVLAKDVATYKGCNRGDWYAMGKTIYELLFAASDDALTDPSLRLTEDNARFENEKFRSLLQKDVATTSASNLQLLPCRFRLSRQTQARILAVIDGLCRERNPISFAEAENMLLANLIIGG